MLIKTNDKYKSARAILELLLKDKTLYCNWCGDDYIHGFVCCENPQIGSHADHLKAVIKQNRIVRETRNNDFASTDDKSFRWGVSLPPRFLREWEKCFKTSQGEKLLGKGDLNKFMKEFPQFCVARRV